MLYINALRGMDSTGVLYVTNDGDVQTHKELGESGKFLKTKEWETTDKELYKNGQAIVGHCRHATRGSKTDDNAHPFIVDNKIVLVHNGSLIGSHDHLAKTEVDSHAIAHVLSEEKDIATAISKINGAYALVWYNTETKKLHAIRNKERPLWFAQVKDGSMIFASESSFLYAACWRNNLEIDEGWPQLLHEHRLFTCDLENIKQDYEWEDLDCAYKAPVHVFQRTKPIETPVSSSVVLLGDASKETKYQRSGSIGVPTLVEVAADIGVGVWQGERSWRTYLRNNAEVVVEADDYRHINGDLFYVYGTITSPDPQADGFAVGWEIQALSEEEVVEYVSRGFFTGKVEFGVGRGVRLRDSEHETALFKLHTVKPLIVHEVAANLEQ